VSGLQLLLFGNVSQPPYCNSLFPPLRAFEKIFRTRLIEPCRFPGFAAGGTARPTLIPDAAVIENTDPPPDVVVCLGGALHFSDSSRRSIRNRKETVVAGFALSDPYGLPASLRIASEFDLFYTADWQTVTDYASLDIVVRRCDLASDPVLYRPTRQEADCDVLYYGKWTPYRHELVSILSERLRVRVHAYSGETRWGIPVLPPLDTPEVLCLALNRCRLALETSRLDDAEGKYRNSFHLTHRTFFAASCGVPSLVEGFPGLEKTFLPGQEVAAFVSRDDLVEQAAKLVGDAEARLAMGRRARQRVLRDHTWDKRAESFFLDVQQCRAKPRRPTR
jgi:glycosyltransferase involved in cell wall biosynthesis